MSSVMIGIIQLSWVVTKCCSSNIVQETPLTAQRHSVQVEQPSSLTI